METVLLVCLGAIFLVFITIAIIYKPWETLIFFGIFLVFQEYFVTVVSDNLSSQFIKNFDEFFIWFFLIVAIALSRNRKIINLDYIIVGMLLVGLISSYLNGVKSIVIVSDIILMFKFFALFRSITLRFSVVPKTEYITSLVYVLCSIFFIVGIIEIFYPEQVKELIWGNAISKITIDERGGIISANCTFVHPVNYGWFMCVGASFAIAHFLILHRRRDLLMFIIFMIGVLLSTRRKPLVGVIISILFLIIISYGNNMPIKKTAIYTILFSITILGFIFWDQIYDIIKSGIEIYFSSESFEKEARNLLYIVSGVIALDHFPFGVGFGRYGGFISIKYYSDVYYNYGLDKIWGLTGNEGDASFGMDTFWPYILGELGIIGLLLFGILLYKLYKKSRYLLKINIDAKSKIFIISTFIIFIESLLEAFATPMYANSITIFYVFVPLAVVFIIHREMIQGFSKTDVCVNC